MRTRVQTVFVAVSRARLAMLAVALTYLLSLLVGIGMVHTGNEFALAQRDSVVGRALASNSATIAYREGDRFRAATADFGQNLVLGAGTSTLTGLAVVTTFPMVVYRGWVGGIVSVDKAHISRLSDPHKAAYYIITLLLQLIPYSLAGGAGLNVGLAYFRPQVSYRGEKMFGYPKEAMRDVLRIFVLVVPLFLIASFWEFFSPWV